MRRLSRILLGCATALLLSGEAFAASPPPPPSNPDLAGEAFGQPVTIAAFSQYFKTAALFTRSGVEAPMPEQTEQEAWQNLMLLHQAAEEGIAIGRTELTNELKRLLQERGVTYDAKGYAEWVRAKMDDDVATFEHRIEDLLKINELVRRHTNPDVRVTDEEVKQKFLNEYNSFECEYIQFDTAAEADAFQQQVREQPGLWKPAFEGKRDDLGQKGAAWINIMSLEALIDLWQFASDDAYRVIEQPEGSFLRAKQIYGEVVLRLLSKHRADPADFTDARRTELHNSLIHSKTYQITKQYFDDLVKRAALRSYIQERRDAQERARVQALIPELQKKSAVVLETSKGTIELKLWPAIAPKTCENFIGLTEKGYYNGLTFHRVKKEFMIQGGDPAGNGSGGESIWGKPFEDEVSEQVTFDRPGLLAMANSGAGTNGSQFFITTVPAKWLDGKHTIFGEVVSGLEVVKQIESVPTDAADKPLEPQKMIKLSIKPAPVPGTSP